MEQGANIGMRFSLLSVVTGKVLPYQISRHGVLKPGVMSTKTRAKRMTWQRQLSLVKRLTYGTVIASATQKTTSVELT